MYHITGDAQTNAVKPLISHFMGMPARKRAAIAIKVTSRAVPRSGCFMIMQMGIKDIVNMPEIANKLNLPFSRSMISSIAIGKKSFMASDG